MIKRFLLVVLLLVGIGAGLTVASHYFPSIKAPKIALPTQLQPLISSSMDKVKHQDLANKVGNIQSKVLGVQSIGTTKNESSETTQDKPEPEQDSVTQKTLDYARYSYCQEVVKQYEAKQAQPSPSTQPVSPSPSPGE